LNRLLMTEIFPIVDHKNLNNDVAFLKHVIPTAENISIQFWKILKSKLNEADLHKIRLLESEKNIVEYFGE
ncbi:MAG: 6-carboxytetrahydropterin synthase, partial [Deltaproteobacteria bacterium]